MNFQKYFKSTALISNPLCGIDTYKDIINLATGQTERKIKKVVLTGNENWQFFQDNLGSWQFYSNILNDYGIATSSAVSNIAPYGVTAENRQLYDYGCYLVNAGRGIAFQMKGAKDTFTDTNAWKSYLAQQYTAGAPITMWYILATPETEQITVPSGLSGTVEGYLTQTGTPTPTDPIYPVANDAVGWYGIKNYVRATTWQDGSTYSRSGGSWSSSVAKKRSRKKK